MMTTDLINHLISSGILTGYAYTEWRDDSTYPFNQDMQIVLIRDQSGPQDKDIGNIGVDIYLHTGKNASNSDRGVMLNTAESLSDWLNYNYKFSRFYGIRISGQKSGPYKDEQNRYFTVIRIQLLRNSGLAG